MPTKNKIPLYIGITGHQNLPFQDYGRLKQTLKEQLIKIKNDHPSTPLIMLNNLAKGADFLGFEAALELSIDVHVILPYAKEDYQNYYSGEDLIRFNQFLDQANEVTLCQNKGKNGCMEKTQLLRQAGIEIAQKCNILIALWDGKPALKNGPSTGNIVEYFLSTEAGFNRYPKRLIHLHCRRSEEDEENFDVVVKNSEISPQKMMKRIEQINCVIDKMGEPDLRSAVRLLSTKAQKNYFTSLRLLAYGCSMAVFAFLIYDEMESNLFLIAFSFLLVLNYLLFKKGTRCSFHDDYLDYRMLSESLRVRQHLLLLNCNDEFEQLCTYNYRMNFSWILAILHNINNQTAEAATASVETIKEEWLNNQLDYHQKNRMCLMKLNKKNQLLSRMLFALSVALYLTVIVIELVNETWMESVLFNDEMATFLLMHTGSSVTVRSLFKIVLGSISALTLFLSSYYGKLSMPRSIEDSERMICLYTETLGLTGQKEMSEVKPALEKLVREEIAENESWYSYSKENEISIEI